MSRTLAVAGLWILIAHAHTLPAVAQSLALAGKVVDGPIYVPALRAGGPLPAFPPHNAVGWFEAVVELQVDAAGVVFEVTPLRASPLPEDIMTPALSQWQFQPATVDRRPVPARVLVTAVVRPPALFNGPTPGNPPKSLAQATPDVPFPIDTPPPAHPPLVVSDALVLLEVNVGADGSVLDARAMAGAPPFTQVSIDAVRRWTFRPAMRSGRSIDAYAYVIIGFRQPLT